MILMSICQCFAGVMTVVKAVGLCRPASEAWPVFQEALDHSMMDIRLCNAVLAHCLRHRDLDHCKQVQAAIESAGLVPNEVTRSLIERTAALVTENTEATPDGLLPLSPGNAFLS